MSTNKIRPIEPWIRKYIEDANLVVLRDKRNNKPLNVSYTEEGLRWTCNKDAKLLFYKNAYLRHRDIGEKIWQPYIVGDTKRNPHVVVEKFVPKDHRREDGRLNIHLQKAEYLWCNKAMRLLYHVGEDFALEDASGERSEPSAGN